MFAPIAIALTFGLAIFGSVMLRHRSHLIRLVVGIASFIIVSALLFPLVGSTLHPAFSADDRSSMAMAERLFVAAWWLLAARITVLSGQIAIGIQHREHAARLASDLGASAIYLGAVLTTLSVAFSVSVPGLLATSGIIAIVLGLALQSTLGDLFSGIAIGIERPFGIGDYVWLEGAVEGSVIETNWRATQIVTDGDDIATVPNSVIAKGRLLNRSRPTETRTDTIRIVLDPIALPRRGIELLNAAILSTRGLAADPPPRVICSDIRGEGTFYELRFSAPRRNLISAKSDLFHNVALHARYAGIAMGMQNGLPLQPIAAYERVRFLADSDLLSDIDRTELCNLAAQLKATRGRPGEALFIQGEDRASLFFIAEGVFEAVVETDGIAKRLGVLAPGEYIGELSLLTGSHNPASVKALTPFLVYELSKEILSPLICRNPNLLHAFEAGAARAQKRLDRLLVTQTQNEKESNHLADRIRSFFGLQV